MATLSGQPHDAPKMWIEYGVTLQERREALLESRFYDQRVFEEFSFKIMTTMHIYLLGVTDFSCL